MKKLSVIALLLACTIGMRAQHQILPFFDDKGVVRIQTTELDEVADTLVTTFHRADDVVWSRIVYRVIDMRYKQNYQLYFPTRHDDPEYRSLFKVIVDGLIDGLPVYQKADDAIKPQYENTISKADLSLLLLMGQPSEGDDVFYNTAKSNGTFLNYDTIPDKLSFNFYPYADFVKNQLKYLIQEVIFFDKHTSRMHTKIIAIAPLQADRISATDASTAMRESLLFWVLFDELRPYLAKQVLIPNGNDNDGLTYDEFFAKKLYSSYLLGDSNLYGRMIVDYSKTEEDVHKEQQRLEDGLLNFEQDLWEY